MFRLDDSTEKGVKYQKRYYLSNKRYKTLGVRVSELQSTIAELKEKFQLSAEQISCLQKSSLDIPSANHKEFHKYNLIKKISLVYIVLRLKHLAKEKNASETKSKIRKKLSKLILNSHQ